MNPQVLIQLATLFSVLVGALYLAVALWINREQLKTQVFLALSARYDELIRSGIWRMTRADTMLPERTDETTILALRYFMLLSVAYLLFRERGIPGRLWQMMRYMAEPRLRDPFLMREWEHLRSEIESLPEFVRLVTSVHQHDQK